MDAKEYLSQIERFQSSISKLEEQIEKIRSDAEGIKGIVYDRDRVSSTPEDMLSLRVSGYIDCMNDLEKLKETYTKKRTEIVKKIIKFPQKSYEQKYADLLYLRYVECMKLWDVAEKMNYSYSAVRKMHGIALSMFNRKYMQKKPKRADVGTQKNKG